MRRWIVLIAAMAMLILPASATRPGDTPAAAVALQALAADDLDYAIDRFQVTLAANPNSAGNWYNLACAYALRGDRELALQALSDAVATGYRDSAWAASDEDLALLHDAPEFAALSTRMGALARQEQRRAGTLHFLPQQRLGAYRLHLPDGYERERSRSYPLLVFLHGRGDTEESAALLVEQMGLPDVIAVRPEAPYAIPGTFNGREYWPVAMRVEADSAGMATAVRMSARWCSDVVRDVAGRLRIDPDRIAVAGFSQGAAMAYAVALEQPELYKAVAVLSGYLPPGYATTAAFEPLARHGASVFIGHGGDDTNVPLARAELAAALARSARVPVTANIYDGGHEITAKELSDLTAWLREVLALGGR